jgi:uncharacterized protein YccT (UPF0319 family)
LEKPTFSDSEKQVTELMVLAVNCLSGCLFVDHLSVLLRSHETEIVFKLWEVFLVLKDEIVYVDHCFAITFEQLLVRRFSCAVRGKKENFVLRCHLGEM